MDDFHDYEAAFLTDAAEQIAYRPLRPSIVRELKDHIEDRTEDYEKEGLEHGDAVKKAVNSMGDAVAVGTGINAVRHVRSNYPLTILTAFLMAAGLASAVCMQWIPEQHSNGFLYYLPGAILLFLVAFRGYPWLIRNQTKLLMTAAVLVFAEAVWTLALPYRTFVPIPRHMIGFYAMLLLGPCLVTALYRCRRRGSRAILAAALLSASAMLFRFYITGGGTFVFSSTAVYLLSMSGTLCFMVHRRIFPGARASLYAVAVIGCLSMFGVFALLPHQKAIAAAFAKPEEEAGSVWEDAYNGVLIKDLLSKTPALGGLSLTPEELMDYGTGSWYFEGGETNGETPGRAPLKGPFSDLPRYLHYTESDVTLWDILPQHYHNNYLIAVYFLLYGRLPGILLLTAIAGFYGIVFRCVLKIRGKLAAAVSFYCGLCLLFQSLLCILGNFGYQYGAFTNLPLVSEGKLSVLVNVLLLGFIFSAYRYDTVIDPFDYEGTVRKTALRKRSPGRV